MEVLALCTFVHVSRSLRAIWLWYFCFVVIFFEECVWLEQTVWNDVLRHNNTHALIMHMHTGARDHLIGFFKGEINLNMN